MKIRYPAVDSGCTTSRAKKSTTESEAKKQLEIVR